MTAFEQYLIDKGFTRHVFNCKTMQYEKADRYIISTLINIDYRYLHDNYGEIVFGLHEAGKPPTLIHPRPRMKITRNGIGSIQDDDNAMNAILHSVEPERVFEAMWDKSKVLTFEK